jgi:flavin reductase (DIM6/NTAB) family NADH-FMN oxidoreductase RutF
MIEDELVANQPSPDATMTPTAAAIDAVLKLVNREVWIVTAASGELRGGLCASWVSAASIDPERPVVVAGLAPNHFTAELVQAAGYFGLHLLRRDQAALALNFALGSGRERDKFAGLALQLSSHGVPLLADCLGNLECRVVTRYDGGDRWYFWADVLDGHQVTADEPLREQELMAAASPEQKQQLVQNRREDASLLRPLHDQWRQHSEP